MSPPSSTHPANAEKSDGGSPPLRLIVVEPSAKGIATMIEELTGRKPDVEQIRARLAAKLADRDRRPDRNE